MAINNYLKVIEFELAIKRLPNVEFFVQKASVPGISTGFVTHPTPFNDVYHTPDRLTYSELNLSFLIDEQMRNYTEIFKWMIGHSFPNNFSQFDSLNKSDDGLYSDIRLLLKNSHINTHIELLFSNAFPIALSEIALDTTMVDVISPEASVTFKYDSFTIQPTS